MAKVLLVEDDPCLCETVSQWLSFQKHNVETATTGLEAVEQLRFDTFDIIVMDWHIPELSGIEVCKRFRSAGGITPILMLSGSDSAAERQVGLSAGATDYLKKPFQLKELTIRMQKLLPNQTA